MGSRRGRGLCGNLSGDQLKEARREASPDKPWTGVAHHGEALAQLVGEFTMVSG